MAGPNRARPRMADLEERVRTAEAAAAGARQAVAQRDALIAAISRELSNQLAPVTLAVERLRRLAVAGNQDRTLSALEMVERACAAFSRRSRSLMEFSALSACLAPVTMAALDLAAVVRAIAERHADVARRAGCPLDLDLPPEVIVRANLAGVEQVVEQLISNALKFGAGRPVAVSLRVQADNHAILSVQDRGPGVPAESIDSLFEPFRTRRATTEPGLGIGLWVASFWAQAMGGSLRLADADGPGVCFECSLALFRQDPSV